MSLARSIALFASISLALLPGCQPTPGQMCRDYVDGMNDLLDRCGYGHLEYTLRVEGHGDRNACELVNDVENPNALLRECLPWMQSVDCAVFEGALPTERLPSSCAPGNFVFRSAS